jgi:hypothetical protein
LKSVLIIHKNADIIICKQKAARKMTLFYKFYSDLTRFVFFKAATESLMVMNNTQLPGTGDVLLLAFHRWWRNWKVWTIFQKKFFFVPPFGGFLVGPPTKFFSFICSEITSRSVWRAVWAFVALKRAVWGIFAINACQEVYSQGYSWEIWFQRLNMASLPPNLRRHIKSCTYWLNRLVATPFVRFKWDHIDSTLWVWTVASSGRTKFSEWLMTSCW